MLKRAIQVLTVCLVCIFPLIYIKGFTYPGIFPRAMITLFFIELLVFLFLWYSLSTSRIFFKKSYITPTLFLYIVTLFISAFLGSDFGQSFWSSFFRMTGIVTWLHYLSLLMVIGATFTDERDWKHIFRAILLSGVVLALVSYLGVDGLNTSIFSTIKEGGSLFGNTSYSGAYYLLVFFISLIGFSLESGKLWRSIYILGLAIIFFNPDLFNFHSFIGVARASTLVLWGGILVISFIFLLHKFFNKKIVVIASSIILLLISSVYIYSFTSLIRHEGKVYDAYLEESGPARPLVWDIAIEGIKSKPILGYGPENFNYIYQEHLNPQIINIEQSTEWFDNVHNFSLSQILDTGFLGTVFLFGVFVLVVFSSFKFYLERNRFYFLIIPFILIFHFLQMQTFFQTDSTLFLVFLIIVFLLFHNDNTEFQMPTHLHTFWAKLILAILLIFSFFFFIYIPMKENLLISKIYSTQDRNTRLELLQHLCCLKIYPIGTLSLLSRQFMDNTAPRVGELEKKGVVKNTGEEYQIYLEAYRTYTSRYENNYRYLVEYANIVNTAFMFGIDELERGEELARQALNISQSYPHPYWVLAINLYYQGKSEEALQYAKLAYNLDPSIERSREVYEILKTNSKLQKGIQKSFIYLNL